MNLTSVGSSIISAIQPFLPRGLHFQSSGTFPCPFEYLNSTEHTHTQLFRMSTVRTWNDPILHETLIYLKELLNVQPPPDHIWLKLQIQTSNSIMKGNVEMARFT